jgi:N utilization substance protein B
MMARSDSSLPPVRPNSSNSANAADADEDLFLLEDAALRVSRGDAHFQRIHERRQARRMALQALFEIDSVGHKPGYVIEERLEYLNPGEHGATFFRWLVVGVVRNEARLDELITKYAPDWPVDQLAIVDRNILRLAFYEIGSHESDAPVKVVINEAVELAKLFGSDSTPRFVNGVLGAALDELGGISF